MNANEITKKTTAGHANPPFGNGIDIGIENSIGREIDSATPGHATPGSGIGRAEGIAIESIPTSAISASAPIAAIGIARDGIIDPKIAAIEGQAG